MTGNHHVEVRNRDAVFKFDLIRNITIVRGDSGTGKTTLYEMISDHTRLKDQSGVNIRCDKQCVALTDTDWRNQLGNTSDSIVFIDEGAAFLKTKDLASSIEGTDNYYVIFCRDSLHELPYSVEEIYEIKTSGKNHSFKKMYGHDTSFVYGKGRSSARPKPDAVLTEDSGSGYQFYKHYFESRDIECFTSGGNSGVFRWVMENKGRRVFIIADGAAFGSEIDRVLKIASSSDMTLCLPESFEWLILRSGLIKGASEKILDDPSSYIDSKDHFSWERYFTQYLVELTDRPENAPFKYYSDKGRIAEAYLIDINAGKIISIIID